ncbi:MAG: TAXI family TRAP transporter solute-binding subunit, partial [Planctomycetaceae bacterium]|nr:TAXI family TRAP transporter solute-binding subunit [Planctomycetaceae bacterium]
MTAARADSVALADHATRQATARFCRLLLTPPLPEIEVLMLRYFPSPVRLLMVLSIAVAAGCGGGGDKAGSGGGDEPKFISIGTAPPGGAFYTVGSAVSDVLNGEKDASGWRQVTAEATGGSLENLRRLESGDVQLALSNSTITWNAVRGEEGFDKKYDVKAVMTLFPLVAMFVTREGSGVETIQDLKGKRVAVGPEGAGFEYFIRPILRAHGVSYDDFEDVYGSMQTSANYLQDESVAATFLGGALRASSITSAAATMDIKLVPYGEQERQQLIAEIPSFNAVVVPAETYKGQTEPFAGLNVGSAHLIVRSDASEEFVAKVVKIIYQNREKVAEKHAAGRSITAENVVRN